MRTAACSPRHWTRRWRCWCITRAGTRSRGASSWTCWPPRRWGVRGRARRLESEEGQALGLAATAAVEGSEVARASGSSCGWGDAGVYGGGVGCRSAGIPSHSWRPRYPARSRGTLGGTVPLDSSRSERRAPDPAVVQQDTAPALPEAHKATAGARATHPRPSRSRCPGRLRRLQHHDRDPPPVRAALIRREPVVVVDRLGPQARALVALRLAGHVVAGQPAGAEEASPAGWPSGSRYQAGCLRRRPWSAISTTWLPSRR